MKTWLILDVSFLCHRNLYAMGNKMSSVDDSGVSQATGVLFGLFRDIGGLQKLHNTKNIVFCFDHGQSKRCEILTGYKKTRKKKREQYTEEEKQAYAEMQKQITMLRKEYLPEMGFKNILSSKGYEADDLIAQCCLNLPDDDNAILVGSDKDLYQLLSKRVSLWNPTKKEMITRNIFKETYKIKPKQWIMVKAIAGCSGDDIPGIDGVGDITAAKYLSGELKKGKKYDSIVNGESKWQSNIPLVSLPYEGCPNVEFQDDEFDTDKWNAVMRRLGMKSMVQMDKKSGFGFGELSL